MFTCPVCGNKSYSEVLSEMFKCDKCSVLFSDPLKFGNTNSEQSTKFKPGQILSKAYTNNIGGVVSTPIKLRRV